MKKYLKIFISSLVSGLFIGLAGLGYLACIALLPDGAGKIVGSFVFASALILIVGVGSHLFTGKIGFVFENKPKFLFDLLTILIGNAIGAILTGYIAYATKVFGDGSTANQIAKAVADFRSIGTTGGETWYSALILSFFCGMFVFMAVLSYAKFEPYALKLISLILCVALFAVSGMEHCIANMFYFSVANSWNMGTILNVLICIVGNGLGSITLYFALRAMGFIKKPIKVS